MDFNQFMLALRARRKTFFTIFFAVVAAAVLVALVVPKRYVAETTILVDMPDAQSIVPAARPMSARDRAGYIQTQIDLITSGRVAAKVAKDLKLAQRPGLREEWEQETGGVGHIEDWIASLLLEQVKADVTASNVVRVQYTGKDAKSAADIANGFAKAYMDTTLVLRTEPSRDAADWFEDQMKRLRAQVNQAQARLTAYQKEKGITYLDERSDLEAARLTELSTQLLEARNTTYDAQTKYKQAQEVAASGTPDAMPELMTNAAIMAVRADLARAESAMQSVSGTLGPNHPVFQRHQSEVQALRGKLQAEMKKAVASFGAAAEQAQRREQALEQAVAAQHKRILQQKDYRIQLATLTRDVDTQQRAYDAALTRMVNYQVDSRAQQTNLAVLTPAIEPWAPSFPNVGLISGLAVMIGLLLAAGVVYLLESVDRRVRSRADLDARLAVPMLGRLSRWQPQASRLLPAPPRRALPKSW